MDIENLTEEEKAELLRQLKAKEVESINIKLEPIMSQYQTLVDIALNLKQEIDISGIDIVDLQEIDYELFNKCLNLVEFINRATR